MICLGLLAIAPAILKAADEAKRPFNIPAGDAVAALKRFSLQSDQQVIFPEDAIEGVTTKAVKGELTPTEAMDRLLAGTSLKVVRDAQSGAFAVSRVVANKKDAPDPNGERAAASEARDFRPETTKAGNAATKDSDSDVLELSPFQVNTSRDNGFVAASALAGGRLATDLADTPVAYSVITHEFIEALGLTDLAAAASWSPNTVTTIAGNGGGYGDDVSNEAGSYNVRGAGNGRRQRNFFPYFAPMDSYSVERFDFGRGPNAILFGNGSLGGVSSTTTKQARFDAPFTSLKQSVGSWSNYRTTFDTNVVLNDSLALRADGVYADSKGWRQRQFDKTKAMFLTGTLKLGANTSIRLEGEYGEGMRNQTFTNTTDQFSGWDGVTTYSGPLNTLPSNSNALGISRRAANYNIYDPFSGVNAVMNYQNDPYTLGGGANAVTPIAGYVQGSLPSFGSNNANILYAYNIPAGRFDNALAGSKFRVPDETFNMASDAAVITQRYRDIQLTVDHRIKRVFIQGAVDISRTNQETKSIDVRGSGVTYIDINALLPNGAANPHFLQPYGDGYIRRGPQERNSNAFRLAAGTTADAGKWGRYIFNTMLGYTDLQDNNTTYDLSIAQNTDHRRWGASGLVLGNTDLIRVRRYWDEPSRPFPSPDSIRYINPITGVDKTINPIWALEDSPVQRIKSTFKYAIAAFTGKYWHDRIVVLGALRMDSFYSIVKSGQHQGDYSATSWDGITPIFLPSAPDDYASLTYLAKDATGKVTNTAPISADNRPRDGNGTPLAQYANDRFRSDFNAPAVKKTELTKSIGTVFHAREWLHPYFNYAETFNPPPALQRIDTSFLPPTVAIGTDFGIRMPFLKNRLNLIFTRYHNKERNSNFSSGIGADINSLAAADALGDATTGRNVRGLASVPPSVQDIRDREANGYELEVVASLTKGLRVTFNVGLPKVYESNSYQDSKRFLDANFPLFGQIVTDAGGLISSTNVASIDTSIPVNQRSPDVGSAVTAYNNLVVKRAGFVDGKRIVQDQPTLNFYADYTLQSGMLKSLRLGAGVQYRGKQIIGNRSSDTIVDPNNPLKAIDNPDVDAYTAIYSPDAYYTVLATIAYTYRLDRKRSLEFNLRIDNLLNERGPIYGVSTTLRPLNGDYTSPARETVPNNYALRTPIAFNLTATLKF